MSEGPIKKDDERGVRPRLRLRPFHYIAWGAPIIWLMAIMLGVVARGAYECFLWGWDFLGF